jgi:sugar phosphate isomerase/epimerase
MAVESFSRRSFLTTSLAVSAASSLTLSAKAKKVPVGLELYSVRNTMGKDLMGTVRAVAKQGYEVVEFYSPYFAWTTDYAKEVKKLLDDVNLKCLSTHNGLNAFKQDTNKAIELNSILGAKHIVLAHPGKTEDTASFWKGIADTLNSADEKFAGAKMTAGYHNHQLEWKEVEGQKPIQLLAANTRKSVMLQFDVGTCLEMGCDPVLWIKANPGRIRSLHLKDWSPDAGYKVLFGEGKAPWPAIFAAAEKSGVDYYLIEQEGFSMPELETVEKCLANYRKIHG